ncbi:MAG: DUF2384 domain-containing protein [Opitutaceae bacterium]|jgi:putative toxin-antitoxin system antitoxin component (TIGR02293 family)|nr:DUF2384 domain-containing protein [Opitutaceae bacterium]
MSATQVFDLVDKPVDEVIVAIRSGLPARSLADVAEALNIPGKLLAEKLHIAPRTLARKLTGGSGLSLETSEKIIRVARIRNLASEIFTDGEAIREWLAQPAPAFNGVPPLDLLDTDTGARQVEALLRGIANGHVI